MPYLPYLDYIGISYRTWEALGDPWFQPGTYKVHYRILYGYIRKKSILGHHQRSVFTKIVEMEPFKPYLCYIGRIKVSPTMPGNNQGYP